MTDFVLVIAAAALLGAAPDAPPANKADSLVLPASSVAAAAAPVPKAPLAASGPQRRVFGSAEACEQAAATLFPPAGKRAVCLPHGGVPLVESAY